MRSTGNILIFLAILAFTAGFFFGPGSGLFWKAAEYTHFLAGIGVLLHLLAFVFPGNRVPVPKRPAEMRKCRTCGRPAVEGSEFCRYHTDEQRWMGGGRI
jgi:hypothetical protein